MSNFGSVLGPLIAGVILAHGGYAGRTASTRRCSPSRSTRRCGCRRCPRSGGPAPPGLRSVLDGLAFIAHPAGAADVVRGRHRGDGVRHAAGAVPGGGRRAVQRRGSGRLAVRGHRIGSVVGGLSSGWIGRVRRQGRRAVVAVVAWGARSRCPGWRSPSGWRWCCWRSPVRPTWSRRSTGRRSCRRSRRTRCAAGCRACSSWWWRAGRGWVTCARVRRPTPSADGGLGRRRGGVRGRGGRGRDLLAGAARLPAYRLEQLLDGDQHVVGAAPGQRHPRTAVPVAVHHPA